jgi:hypothetical protein
MRHSCRAKFRSEVAKWSKLVTQMNIRMDECGANVLRILT